MPSRLPAFAGASGRHIDDVVAIARVDNARCARALDVERVVSSAERDLYLSDAVVVDFTGHAETNDLAGCQRRPTLSFASPESSMFSKSFALAAAMNRQERANEVGHAEVVMRLGADINRVVGLCCR